MVAVLAGLRGALLVAKAAAGEHRRMLACSGAMRKRTLLKIHGKREQLGETKAEEPLGRHTAVS